MSEKLDWVMFRFLTIDIKDLEKCSEVLCYSNTMQSYSCYEFICQQ